MSAARPAVVLDGLVLRGVVRDGYFVDIGIPDANRVTNHPAALST
jgi:hypothetical protein